MKSFAAASEPFEAVRRRSRAEAGAERGRSASLEQVAFLGLSEAELTPAMKAALGALMVELQDLRTQMRALKARLAQAEAAADADPLTSAQNRRAFVREVKRIVAFVRRYGAPASLLYFDLDGLKDVNDRFGHAAGDVALKAVADRLVSHVRASDVVGRLGGDEFAVLLAQADLPTAEAKAKSLTQVIAAEPVQIGARLVHVRVSWGACRIDPAKDPETLIAEADAAMFAMKRGGASAA